MVDVSLPTFHINMEVSWTIKKNIYLPAKTVDIQMMRPVRRLYPALRKDLKTRALTKAVLAKWKNLLFTREI